MLLTLSKFRLPIPAASRALSKALSFVPPSAAPASRVNFLGVGKVGNIRFHPPCSVACALIPDDKSCNIQMIIPEYTGKINHFFVKKISCLTPPYIWNLPVLFQYLKQVLTPDRPWVCLQRSGRQPFFHQLREVFFLYSQIPPG